MLCHGTACAEAAVLSIMSLHADIEYRSPSFCTPLHHLFPGGTPLEYADAQQLFKQDKRSDWAAYIAGCGCGCGRGHQISGCWLELRDVTAVWCN